MKRLLPVLALALAVAMPLGAAARTKHAGAMSNAATPSGVSCASGDAVVWLNTGTKVFHLPGSSYYGKTKQGKYLCQSDALKLGAHASKREGHGSAMSGGAMNGTPDSDMSNGASPAPGMSGGKHHHHRRHGGTPMSPLPNPSPM